MRQFEEEEKSSAFVFCLATQALKRDGGEEFQNVRTGEGGGRLLLWE